MTDKEMEARDDRVRDAIVSAIEEHERIIRDSKKFIAELTTNVMAGRWFNLKGVLSESDINGLCECDLSDKSLYLTKD